MEGLVPTHIAFILDGNRRWAKERGLPTFFGHSKGVERAKEIIEHAYTRNIPVISMYCFSKENWSRAKKEVGYLMRLFSKFLLDNIDDFHEKGVRLVHLGEMAGLPASLANSLTRAIEKTKDNEKMVVQLALNYTGRDEIRRAVEKMVGDQLPVTIENIESSLDTCKLPDPDMIVRTSGEQRLSGFLIWQAAYAELYFPPIHWPDFTPEEFDKALSEYQSRQRRFGS